MTPGAPGSPMVSLDAVNKRQVSQHEHADPCQLPAFFEFRAVGAQVASDLLAQPFHFWGGGAIACHGVAGLLVARDRLDEPDEGDAANLGIGFVSPFRHDFDAVVRAERAAGEFERQDLAEFRLDVLEQAEGLAEDLLRLLVGPAGVRPENRRGNGVRDTGSDRRRVVDELVCELLDDWLPGPGADDGRGMPHQGMGAYRRAQCRQLGRVVAGEHLPRGSGFGVLLPRSVLEPLPGVGHRLGHDNALLVAPGLVGLPQQGHQDGEAFRRAEHVDGDACHRCGVRVIAAEPGGEGLADLVVV